MKLRMHTKRYYLKKIQEGVLKKETVAAIFNTSVTNVENALKEYKLKKNPFRTKYEGINSLLSLVISIFSTLLVLLTLFEMQEARNATYMPDIVLDNVEFATAWDSNGLLPSATDKLDIDIGNLITEEELNIYQNVNIYNLGVGIAKDVVIRWNHDKNIQQFSDSLEDYKDISIDYRNGMIYVTTAATSYGTGGGVIDGFEFLINSVQDNNTIQIPIMYIQLYRELLIRSARTDFPILFLDIDYYDIQGKHYSKKCSLNMDLVFYSESLEGNGCCKYRLVFREE